MRICRSLESICLGFLLHCSPYWRYGFICQTSLLLASSSVSIKICYKMAMSGIRTSMGLGFVPAEYSGSPKLLMGSYVIWRSINEYCAWIGSNLSCNIGEYYTCSHSVRLIFYPRIGHDILLAIYSLLYMLPIWCAA